MRWVSNSQRGILHECRARVIGPAAQGPEGQSSHCRVAPAICAAAESGGKGNETPRHDNFAPSSDDHRPPISGPR